MVVPRPHAPVPHPVPVVFFGSPPFAVPSLVALAEDGRFAVRLVVTQPPKPVGRDRRIQRSAVHATAERLNIPVFTPERLRGTEALAPLRDADATLFIVAAYGKILRPDVLALPSHGTLNVHASLLPAYRGASPIAAAIFDGAAETGVSIMLLDPGLDTGPVLARAAIPLPPDATTATLTEQLAKLGAALLPETAARWLVGAITPQPQDDAAATMTRTLRKEDGAIDWTEPAARIARMERAYTPWPGVFTWLGGRRVLLHGMRGGWQAAVDAAPGTIIAAGGDGVQVVTGDGVLVVARVQPEGRPAMDAAAFAAGRPGLVGTRFESVGGNSREAGDNNTENTEDTEGTEKETAEKHVRRAKEDV